MFHEHCLYCAPKRARLADHQEPCIYCKALTTEFDMESGGCSRHRTEYKQFQHAACRDKSMAEQAEAWKQIDIESRQRWALEHAGEPYPEIKCAVVPWPDFKTEDQTLLAYDAPTFRILEENSLDGLKKERS